MAFLDKSKANYAFKSLLGKAHTSNGREISNESIPSGIILSASRIFADSINSTPNDSSNTGIVSAQITLALEAVTGSDTQVIGTYQAYRAKLNGAVPASLVGKINPITKAIYAANDYVGNIIPQSFGDNYRPILYSDAAATVEIPPSSSADWFIDCYSGIIVQEGYDDGTAFILGANGRLKAYIYVGRFVTDALTSGGSGGSGSSEWLDSAKGFSQDLIGGTNAFFNFYDDVALTTHIDQSLLINGLRWIHIGSTVSGLNIYNRTTNMFSTGSISNNDVVEYYVSSGTSGTVGYIKTTPTNGTFISFDADTSRIYRFTGSTWITQDFGSTASNGLTKVGNSIQLGGALTHTTAVDASIYDIELVSGDGVVKLTQYGQVGYIDINGAGGVYIESNGTGGFGVNLTTTLGNDITMTSDNNIALSAANINTTTSNNTTITSAKDITIHGTSITNDVLLISGSTAPSDENSSVKARGANLIIDSRYVGIDIDNPDLFSTITFLGDVMTISGSPGTYRGTEYDIDYSERYSDRSLVDKAYVLKAIAEAGTNGVTIDTASNGLTKIGQDVQLGGMLTSTTAINGGNSYGLQLVQLDTFLAQVGGGIQILNNTTGNFIMHNYGDGNTEIQSGGSTTTFNIEHQGTSDFTLSNIGGGNFTMINNSAGNLVIENNYLGNLVVTNSVGSNELIIENQGTNVQLLNEGIGFTTISSGASTTQFTIEHQGTGNLLIQNTGTGQIELSNSSYTVFLDTVGAMVYAADYSADFLAHTLVDKAYVLNRIAMAGTNGVTINTASNGLTKVGQDVRLGGTLTQNTTIDGASGAYGFFVQNISSFNVDATGATSTFALSAGDGDGSGTAYYDRSTNALNQTVVTILDDTALISIKTIGSSGQTSIEVGADVNALKITDLRTTATGIEYAADYSANYTNRSLVDKEYVDIATSNITASNGLNKVVNDIQLGGALTQPTTVVGDTTVQGLIFDTAGTYLFPDSVSLFRGDINTLTNYGYITVRESPDKTVELYSQNADGVAVANANIKAYSSSDSGNVQLYSQNQSQAITFSLGVTSDVPNVTMYGSPAFRGIEYDVDYSANYTNRSLVDKEYVVNKIYQAGTSGVAITASNGLTKVGNDVQLGGSLTDNVVIDGVNSYSLQLFNLVSLNTTSVSNTSLVANNGTQIVTAELMPTASQAQLKITATDDNNVTSSQIYAHGGDHQTYMMVLWNSGADQARLGIQQDKVFIESSDPLFSGAQYGSDFSANYVDRSLVDKAYVDSVAAGLDPKESVRVATTTFIALSGLQTIDGVSLNDGDRVLVKNQGTSGESNGIYNAHAGAWTRSSDFDGTPANEVTAGAFTFVTEGTNYSDTGWVLATNDPIVLGTTPLTFVQFSAAGVINANNGLTQVGQNIQLGGTLLQNTNISGGSTKSLSLTALSSFTVDAPVFTLTNALNATTAGYDLVVRNSATGVLEKVSGTALTGSVPTIANKHMTPSAGTNGNGIMTNLTITYTPSADGYVEVLVNGIGIYLGTSSSIGDGYFAAPGSGGTVGRAISNIQAGDEFWWNGIIAGYVLDGSDSVDFLYSV